MKIIAGQSPCPNAVRPLGYKGDVRSLKYNKVPRGTGLVESTAKYLDKRVCPNNSHLVAAANYNRLEPIEGCNAYLATTNSDMLLRGTTAGDLDPVGTDYEIRSYNEADESYYSIKGFPPSPAIVFDNPVTQRIFNRDLYKQYSRLCYPHYT
jgi:hypothetical protein